MNPLVLAALLVVGVSIGETLPPSPLVSLPGDRVTIPGWHLQSTKLAGENVSGLSIAGIDVSDWHRIGSRGTVMAGLTESGVYTDSTLFFSTNLDTLVDRSLFDSPWLYREEFVLDAQPGQHLFLATHGITPRADIFVNGRLLASKDEQVGSYGGHKYRITEHVVHGTNCILIQAYPTNYLRDFAMGFIDWNPYPPDNGTGVWRDIQLSLTREVAYISPIRVLTDLKDAKAQKVKVTVKADVRNLKNVAVRARVEGDIQADDGSRPVLISQSITLEANEERTISIDAVIEHPRMWWPALWGRQHLYDVNLRVYAEGGLSDVAARAAFGIRKVEASLNSADDIRFSVNGEPFLVMGAGYTPDMFMRFDIERLKVQFQYILDMGLNTVRLEGKQEHPEFYDLANRMGLMVIAGWECCDKWEGWSYNEDADGEPWDDEDYQTANAAMLHEAAMMQSHPSMLAFLVGSDYWPDDRATRIYVDALNRMDWNNPIVSSASKRGFPRLLGPSGMEMDGPYDWVPPNYWYGDRLGAAQGFSSELGAGVGTPELRSLKKFLSEEDLRDLWTQPDKDLFHMSRNGSQFASRSIYNAALRARYGEPKSLNDYLLKTGLMDFEATRAQFESYGVRKSSNPPATGLIYWMLNGAWPNLHWSLFDYYMKPIASYFGTKVGTRTEHVAFDYQQAAVYVINHSLTRDGPRTVSVDLIDLQGNYLWHETLQTATVPNASKKVATVAGIDQIRTMALLKLVMTDDADSVLSRNVYWLSRQRDMLAWDNSTWYHTPVSEYANFQSLEGLSSASVTVTVATDGVAPDLTAQVILENKSEIPAFFLRLNVMDTEADEDISPIYWSDNYVTLWPGETLELEVGFAASRCTSRTFIEVSGYNVDDFTVKVC